MRAGCAVSSDIDVGKDDARIDFGVGVDLTSGETLLETEAPEMMTPAVMTELTACLCGRFAEDNLAGVLAHARADGQPCRTS